MAAKNIKTKVIDENIVDASLVFETGEIPTVEQSITAKKLGVGKKLVKFIGENASFTTPEGILFSKQHPYRILEEKYATELVERLSKKFAIVKESEAVEFYAKKK